MISLTRSLAQEYGRYGIRANIVLPGTVRTPLWQRRAAKDPKVLETLKRWYPLGRIVEPVDIARAVGFLASDAASAITGVSPAGRLRLDVRQHRHAARADARRLVSVPHAMAREARRSGDGCAGCAIPAARLPFQGLSRLFLSLRPSVPPSLRSVTPLAALAIGFITILHTNYCEIEARRNQIQASSQPAGLTRGTRSRSRASARAHSQTTTRSKASGLGPTRLTSGARHAGRRRLLELRRERANTIYVEKNPSAGFNSATDMILSVQASTNTAMGYET